MCVYLSLKQLQFIILQKLELFFLNYCCLVNYDENITFTKFYYHHGLKQWYFSNFISQCIQGCHTLREFRETKEIFQITENLRETQGI